MKNPAAFYNAFLHPIDSILSYIWSEDLKQNARSNR